MKGNDEVSVMLIIYVRGHSQAVVDVGSDQISSATMEWWTTTYMNQFMCLLLHQWPPQSNERFLLLKILPWSWGWKRDGKIRKCWLDC